MSLAGSCIDLQYYTVTATVLHTRLQCYSLTHLFSRRSLTTFFSDDVCKCLLINLSRYASTLSLQKTSTPSGLAHTCCSPGLYPCLRHVHTSALQGTPKTTHSQPLEVHSGQDRMTSFNFNMRSALDMLSVSMGSQPSSCTWELSSDFSFDAVIFSTLEFLHVHPVRSLEARIAFISRLISVTFTEATPPSLSEPLVVEAEADSTFADE